MTTRPRLGLLAKLIALLLAFTMVAAACGGDDGDGGDTTTGDDGDSGDSGDTAGDDSGDDTDSTGNEVEGEGDVDADAETAVRGGTLRIAVEAETDGLNPTANNFAVSAYTMAYPVFDPLFYFDEDGNWFPWLAESAEPVGDGSSWQVKLREGITFHDGVPLNADALIKQHETILADPIISLAVRPNFPAENQVEKIDDLTVQYNLIRPSAHFPVNLTSQLGMIASPTWLTDAAADESLNQFPVGTGPFMIESRTQDVSTRLVKNPNYWRGTDDIYLDAIEVFITTDTAQAAEQLAVGALDVVITSNPDATLTLRDAPGVTTVENLLSGEDFAMMNTGKAPFDDIRARQALTFATPREAYGELIARGTKPLADSMYHPDLVWNNPDVVQEGDMPERSGPLVAEYCGEFPENCTDGKIDMELQFSGPSTTQTRIAELLGSSWDEFFNITEEQLPQDQHITQVATGQWQVVTWRQFGEVDPDNAVVWLECATAEGLIALNWPRWCNQQRDALLFEQRATTDQARRIEIMKEIQVEMNQAYTYIFFTHANWTVGFRDAVKNLCGQQGPGGDTSDPAQNVTLICNNQGRSFFHNMWIDEG